MNSIKLEINRLKEENNFRTIKNIEKKDGKYIFVNGKKLLNLSSNDYLGLGNDINIKKEFFEKCYMGYSFSSSSSRLLTGNEEIYFELENNLANLFNKNKALLFNSGYAANIGIISSILNKNDLIISDKLNHASIVDGIKLSGAKFLRYSHLNYEQLENYLIKERNNYEKILVISESLFSMDGDFVNIDKLVELKKKYDCLLMIDESHSFGVYGKNGLGCCEEKNQLENADIIMSGLGKACGSVGAFCVANNDIIDYIVNRARSFIFSTALPPINIAWSNFIISKVFPKLKDRREKLVSTSKKFNDEIKSIGFQNESESFIIPIILNSEEQLKNIQKKMLENNYYVLPIRYPTVPKNTPRFRISLTSNIDYQGIEDIIKILR